MGFTDGKPVFGDLYFGFLHTFHFSEVDEERAVDATEAIRVEAFLEVFQAAECQYRLSIGQKKSRITIPVDVIRLK